MSLLWKDWTCRPWKGYRTSGAFKLCPSSTAILYAERWGSMWWQTGRWQYNQKNRGKLTFL